MKLLQILIQYAEVLERRDVCGCWLWKTAVIDHQGLLQYFFTNGEEKPDPASVSPWKKWKWKTVSSSVSANPFAII